MENQNKQMVDDCVSVINIPVYRGGPGYNDWEKEFIESIEDQISSGRKLSEKQEGLLKKLWDRI